MASRGEKSKPDIVMGSKGGKSRPDNESKAKRQKVSFRSKVFSFDFIFFQYERPIYLLLMRVSMAYWKSVNGFLFFLSDARSS